jgi:hypothetical protein
MALPMMAGAPPGGRMGPAQHEMMRKWAESLGSLRFTQGAAKAGVTSAAQAAAAHASAAASGAAAAATGTAKQQTKDGGDPWWLKNPPWW